MSPGRTVRGASFRVFLTLFLASLLCTVVFTASVAGEPTTGLRIVQYGPDGITVQNETRVSIAWMEQYLPVQGDGVTHYYHQGPVFVDDKEAQWDPGETANFKDMGAVKGTAVRDLCDLVGGMAPGDEVMVKAVDGYHVEFPRENVYDPSSRQGNITVCWYNGDESSAGERQGTGYPSSYNVGMRLVFFADNSTNSAGKHVFGNQDMRAVMPPDTIHLFDELYPSTSGYTVKWVDEVRVYQGGYHGSADLLPKSLESKMDETFPSTPASAASGAALPFAALTVMAGALLFRRCGR
ncbi:hypothetical protein J2741_000704 [Methanolinea mesophila]|uniref:argininosuccinate synthase n=1 Tax=Methanolinea mesophila TaxID=547055 RepID=UPI001AE7E595|nr:argininosuccinate synthase [Methanolinea mesophila]MBP1928157.1 hypothetical protein [Methanolinea mesophila]